MACLYAGTSGFSYPTWRGGFYPPDASPADFLRLYARRLSAVELNVTSYRLPTATQLQSWAGQTPEGFRFAVRMSRRVTDRGELGFAAGFCERVRALGERLGPIYVSLPEERERDDGFLRELLGRLPRELRVAVELRHPSWAVTQVADIVEASGAVSVGSLDGSAGFAYLRMREPPYEDSALFRLAGEVEGALGRGMGVYCFFKHEDDPRGARYAERLLAAVRPPC
jgi:uncharacterized protein YecE (DUF72 family)